MAGYTELFITLRKDIRKVADDDLNVDYQVVIVLNTFDDIVYPPNIAFPQIDLQYLSKLSYDLDLEENFRAYGEYLRSSIFSIESKATEIFRKAEEASRKSNTALRIHLIIDESALELREIRWEAMRQPLSEGLLVTSERTIFSRYVEPLRLPSDIPSFGELKALIMIANPTDHKIHGLDKIEVEIELQRAEKALAGLSVTTLASGGKATLENLINCVKNGHQLVYLICHGTIDEETRKTNIWLERGDGKAVEVRGSELVEQLFELSVLPRLIVLSACQSASEFAVTNLEDEESALKGPQSEHGARVFETLNSLGARLARHGVPAVLAMHGNIRQDTLNILIPKFFEELRNHNGQIDRALAIARRDIRNQPDSWMPVLFTSLKSGQLWDTPGFTEESGGLGERGWKTLASDIGQLDDFKSKNPEKYLCTPILGPGLYEAYLGTRREIARGWSEAFGFPMVPARTSLPEVAQFLASIYDDQLRPLKQLRTYLADLARDRYKRELEGFDSEATATLDQLAIELRRRIGKNEAEPYKILARMPVPIYISAVQNSVLEDALAQQGRTPIREICRWNAALENNDDLGPEISLRDPDYRPSPESPLVYYIFGHLQYPASVVLTEDDYFDFLVGVGRRRHLVPEFVRKAMMNTTLLFLGFQVDDWNFRTLFRTIRMLPGAESRTKGFAVQLEPDRERIIDKNQAVNYLTRYLSVQSTEVYWGSVGKFMEDFLKWT